MHRNNQNSDFRSHSYLPLSNSRSSQNTYYQYYNSHLSTQQSLYSNTTARVRQQYQPLTTILDLAEPISVFDDLKFPRQHRSNIIPFLPPYLPPDPTRRTLITDAGLATANALRERLLIDIQHNIREIDQELSSLERRPFIPRYLPPRLSSIDEKTPLSNDNKEMWPNKPKRVYEIIPRNKSESKIVSPHSISRLTNQMNLPSYIGKYHYAAEIEELEIVENDPENSDLKFTTNEIPQLSSHQTLSLAQFRREQSALPLNRALNFVPEYGDHNENEFNETTKDFHQNGPIYTNTAQLSTVNPSRNPTSANKLNIQDFQLLIKTAAEPKIEIPPSSSVNPNNISDVFGTDSTNTMLIKPVKHARLSTRTQETSSSSRHNTDGDAGYFFSDFGDEDEDEKEDLTLNDRNHFSLLNESKNTSDHNKSNILSRPSQALLLNTSSSQQQQPTIKNANEHAKKTEKKKTDATTKGMATSTPPSKKKLPISINNNMQIQFERNNNKVKKNQPATSTSRFNINTIEQRRKNKPSNISITLHSIPSTQEHQISSENMNSTQQQSTSLHHSPKTQSSNILTQDQSINNSDIHEISTKQTEHILNNKELIPIESPRSSAIPIPLNSPDFDNVRPSASRSATPERRNSIPSLNLNILPTSTDLMTFDNLNTDHFQMNTKRELVNESLQKTQQSNQDQNPSQTKKTKHYRLRLPSISPRRNNISDVHLTSVHQEDISRDHNNNQMKEPSSESKLITEEDFPTITASQRRSKLSLIILRSKSKQQNSIKDQIHTMNNNKNSEQHHHVILSNNISDIQTKEYNPLKNWRERINNILTKNRFPSDKYPHIKSRVNSFANFEYQPRRFIIAPKKKLRTKVSSNHTKENKPKKPKTPPKRKIPLVKGATPHLFGRVLRLPDGRPKIFHESLNWNAESKLKAYSVENLHYKSRRNDTRKPRWHSESRASELIKGTPRHQIPVQTISLSSIPDFAESNFHQQESETEKKIFDINSSSLQSISKFQESFLSNTTKRSDKAIFNEKLAWTKKSKLKDWIWGNINYQPKKPTKVRITHSLTLDIQAKIKYWSEIDLDQLTKNKALFSQYRNPKWNDIITDNNYSSTQDYIEKNFNNQLQEESPANRPKWNSVSRTRSLNTVYNPKVTNSNSTRRGWDLELRRKRVQKLPPLKRKRDHEEIPQTTTESPPSNGQLAIDYNYDHSPTVHECAASIDYVTSSRRSSRALVPLRRLPDLQLLSETPRSSQRPVQQEWYDELSKSRSTHRTDMGRTRNNSVQESIGSIQQTNSPREPLTLRSSTRDSQNSVVSGTLLDSSVRTNRTTELRLSKDMEEYHQHSHDPKQSMPFEIRGFRLEGTQISVPDNATIRPLSNVNYRTSERVKNRRIYPWSNLPQGLLSRNSSLLPITEFRHPSFETSILEVPQMIREE